MARKNKGFFWHVGEGMWSDGAPGVQSSTVTTNNGIDIVVVLIDTVEPAAAEPVVPENDNFVVERIIGQWQLRSTAAIARDAFIHERIYLAQVAPASISVRDLASQEQADTSLLWTQVTPWSAEWNNDSWGNWQGASVVSDRPGIFRAGGPNFRDVRVGRRISEGEALIYHLQIEASTPPADNEFHLEMWMRCLVREG